VGENAYGRSVPADEHGVSKFVEALWLRGDPEAVELRVFGVYGPGEDYAIRFLSNACCKALFDMPITLRQDRRFSYVCVEDLGPVVEHFLEGGTPGVYNVTPNEAHRLRSLADLVLRVSGKDLPVIVTSPGEGPAYSGSNGRLLAEMPSLNLTPVDAGVRNLYEWYAGRRSEIRYEALTEDR
jgi:UDP-glucose 4-epimerase